MTVRQLILASTSSYRRELLARLRIPFDTAAPRFEELPPPPGAVTESEVRQLVLQNARGKAGSLRDAYPDGLLLASDQVGECEGRILNKPLTEERAVGQLLFLRGREHRLHTAVVLLDARSGREVEEVRGPELGEEVGPGDHDEDGEPRDGVPPRDPAGRGGDLSTGMAPMSMDGRLVAGWVLLS